MARIFTEGFESGDILFFTVNYGSITTTNPRSGSRCFSLGNPFYPSIKSITSVAEAYFRIPIYTSGNGSFFEWYYSTVMLGSIRINNVSRKIEIYTSTGTLVATGTVGILINTWYLIEAYIKIDNAGTITVKVDGTQDVTYSGNTNPNGNNAIDNVRYSNCIIDDIAMNDTAGVVDNSWCGDGRVIALIPNANGDLSQLAGSDGNSTDNYLLVDETPADNDTTYVEGSAVDQKDLYNFTASGLAVGIAIKRVWAESRSRDTMGAGGLIALALKTGGTEYPGSDIALATSYAAVRGTVYTVNPGTGAAWTIAELDALQAGPKTRS